MDVGQLIGYMVLALTGIVSTPEIAVLVVAACVVDLARRLVGVVKRIAV